MRYILRFSALVCALLAPLAIQSAALADPTVNNFTIADYQITYHLSRNAAGRSQLQTVEDITAAFPAYDQNHGIERAIPESYDGHTTALHIRSVTDAGGKAQTYTTYQSNGNLVVRIGDAGTYVHGAQEYLITYTQQDVTKYFPDTARDEWYWDTNGTAWSVPIAHLSVAVHMDGSLLPKRVGSTQCYQGTTGSTERCDVTTADDGFTLNAQALAPAQNVTLAAGFMPHTFRPYVPTLTDRILGLWTVLFLATSLLGTAVAVWFIVRYVRTSNRSADRTSIVPEYIPPPQASVAVSARIYPKSHAVTSAQLIDLAVRGYLKIYQTSERSMFSTAKYELEIIKDIAGLRPEEQSFLHAIFPTTAIGTRLVLDDLKKDSTRVATQLSADRRRLDREIRGAYNLRAQAVNERVWFKRAALVCLIAALITVSPGLLLAAVVALSCAYLLYPLTDKGLALRQYLEGLKVYIQVAETERLRMLQGPDTAEKIGVPINTADTRQLVQLYERVLPYAMLFGIEKKWNAQLGLYYESVQMAPVWFYAHNAVFNATLFDAAMTSFSTSVSYSSAISSTSGGSGGGGFSGGGGGGGGGGGW